MFTEEHSLLTYGEVADSLNVSRRHVSNLVAEGLLQPIRFGRRCVRFDPKDVQDYIDRARKSRRFRRPAGE